MQAGGFFRVRGEVDTGATYILLDDIYTTGSTVAAAAQALRDAGASEVRIVVLARQNKS